jgi:predicted transcriptional regulator
MTKVKLDDRLELLNNRATFLYKELERIEKEVDLLTQLRTLYNTTAEDPIDDAPDNHADRYADAVKTEQATEPIVKRKSTAKNGNIFRVLKVLSDNGPATYGDIETKTGLDWKQISGSIRYLEKRGLVNRVNGINTITESGLRYFLLKNGSKEE